MSEPSATLPLTDAEYEALTTEIGPERASAIFLKIAEFLGQNDEQGFYAWRAALPARERQFVHASAERGPTARAARAGQATVQMHAIRNRECPHCWHVTQVLLTMPPQNQEICCRCGEKRTAWNPPADGHGPFLPK